jgi:hypothetical protein
MYRLDRSDYEPEKGKKPCVKIWGGRGEGWKRRRGRREVGGGTG